jgi:predicted N-acetyltransferase YhbS
MTLISAERPPAPFSGLTLRAEQPVDASGIEALNDRAFGPGRFAKVSYAVRELARARPDLSVCAFEGDELVGSVHLSEISLGGRDVLFLGPLSVDAACRGWGLGAALMRQAIEAATDAGAPGILLVGDLPLFSRHGFVRVPPGQVEAPRPFDPLRLLWLSLDGGGLEAAAGRIGSPSAS